MSHITLKPTSWRWKCLSSDPLSELSQSDSWQPCSQFPTEIHLEHMRAGLIPHPYKGRNEHQVQWISEKDWLFAADVNVNEVKELTNVEIEFEGLDTFVTVYWNGMVILEGNNHFMKYKVRPSHVIEPCNG
jgi:beta-mannosidase